MGYPYVDLWRQRSYSHVVSTILTGWHRQEWPSNPFDWSSTGLSNHQPPPRGTETCIYLPGGTRNLGLSGGDRQWPIWWEWVPWWCKVTSTWCDQAGNGRRTMNDVSILSALARWAGEQHATCKRSKEKTMTFTCPCYRLLTMHAMRGV